MFTNRLFMLFVAIILAIVSGMYPRARVLATGAVGSKLIAISGQGAGRVVVSPTSQDQGTFAAEITVNIHDTAPNTTFSIIRAPDLNPDGFCTGSYIPFGESLTTSVGGSGATHFHFERGAPLLSGVRFDVAFRAVSSDGAIVLQSDCMTVTVK